MGHRQSSMLVENKVVCTSTEKYHISQKKNPVKYFVLVTEKERSVLVSFGFRKIN